jgi:RHH-type transcriptional regulator, rel operon repressor / antitoxin RelB
VETGKGYRRVATAALTVQISEVDKGRLEALADATGRSESLLAAEAVSEYLALQEWQVSAIEVGIASLDREGGIAHAAARRWIESWDSDKELDPPKPRA